MMRERGLDVDHSTIFRWVQRYAPEINKRIRRHLKMSSTSYRVDETFIKVGKSCKYPYRAVDKEGQTIEVASFSPSPLIVAKIFIATLPAGLRFLQEEVIRLLKETFGDVVVHG